MDHGMLRANTQPGQAGTKQDWTTENAEIQGEQRLKLLPQRSQRFAEEIKNFLVFPLFSSSAPSAVKYFVHFASDSTGKRLKEFCYVEKVYDYRMAGLMSFCRIAIDGSGSGQRAKC